jgi:hypothetical protein
MLPVPTPRPDAPARPHAVHVRTIAANLSEVARDGATVGGKTRARPRRHVGPRRAYSTAVAIACMRYHVIAPAPAFDAMSMSNCKQWHRAASQK